MKIEVSHGEIVDKLTILQIKKENITDPSKLDNIVKEYDYLLSVVENDLGISTESPEYLELLSINKELWVIEDDKRQCEKEKDFTDKRIELISFIEGITANDEFNIAKIAVNKNDFNSEYCHLLRLENK